MNKKFTNVSFESQSRMSSPTHELSASSVGIVRAASEYRLVAILPFVAGDRLFQVEGELTSHPSRNSIQVGENQHIDLGVGHTQEEILDRYFWRFMNHSCEPNVVVRGRAVLACRDIEAWEDITFDYNTTEYDMAEPFECRCGSPICRGRIQGFKYLSEADQRRLEPFLPPHFRVYLRATSTRPGQPLQIGAVGSLG
ncbi:MAG: SET domain-containing protein-lysine N-methyltransferase [Pedosphaera sp.]|nr:SET domain-containing protein-lysine N-methyltransferase [Pedosphaera sp.]